MTGFAFDSVAFDARDSEEEMFLFSVNMKFSTAGSDSI